MPTKTVAAIDNEFILVTTVSIYVYDYLSSVPSELAFYWRRGVRGFRSPVVVLFFLLRYITLFNSLLALYLNFGDPAVFDCVWMAKTYDAMILVTQACVSLLFLLRVYAITNRNRYICGGLLALLVGSIIPGLLYNADIHRTDNTTCKFYTPAPWRLGIFYALSLVYDTTVFVVSGMKLWKGFHRLGFWSPIARMLFKDGAVYFGVSVIVLANATAWELVPRRTHLIGIGGAFLSLTAITAQRVVLHHLSDFNVHGSNTTYSRTRQSSKAAAMTPSRSSFKFMRQPSQAGPKSPGPITSPLPVVMKQVYVEEEYEMGSERL